MLLLLFALSEVLEDVFSDRDEVGQGFREEHYWLVIGGLEHFLFSHILGIIIPID